MLTDLNFLNVGQPFPPKDKDTISRLKRYNKNKLIFEGEHAEVYREQFKRIERVIGNFGEVISYPVIANYQKLISLKVADMLFGEFPVFTAGKDKSPEQSTIELIKENTDLINTLYESAIDVSRYGDGILYVYMDGDKGVIDASQPAMWFPIVSNDNIKRIKYQVLAWQYCTGEGNDEKSFLKVQIHEKGFYTENEYQLSSNAIGNSEIHRLLTSTTVMTGLDDYAIIHVPNIMTSDRCTGIDDYRDIDSIISEILVRVAQISRVLDKHAAPSVSGPSTALEKDPETGEWKLKMGNYFPRDSSDEPNVEYVTWDGQLEPSFKALETLINMLYIISEMGAILLGDTDKMGNAASGTALRLKMMSPLAKVKRLAMRYTPAIKKALTLCSMLGGEGITSLVGKPISITWLDGIPNDKKEISDIVTARTGGKATMSVKRALMQYDDLTEEAADEELELINEEDAAASALTNSDPFAGEDKDEEGEE